MELLEVSDAAMAKYFTMMLDGMARTAKPPNTKICLGRKVSPWTASWLMIEEAIGPKGDDTEELTMKAPMSVSKPVDLG